MLKKVTFEKTSSKDLEGIVDESRKKKANGIPQNIEL
jgi:hypothetical protein